MLQSALLANPRHLVSAKEVGNHQPQRVERARIVLSARKDITYTNQNMVFDTNIQRIVGPHHTNLVAKPARLNVRSLQRTLKFVWCEIYVRAPGLVNFIMIIIYMYICF